jgi:hypothetical protein
MSNPAAQSTACWTAATILTGLTPMSFSSALVCSSGSSACASMPGKLLADHAAAACRSNLTWVAGVNYLGRLTTTILAGGGGRSCR